MTAARVAQQVREKMLIVADGEKIIWIWPIRISELAKIYAGTRNILQLQISELIRPITTDSTVRYRGYRTLK